jgi:hypothetical protein
MSLSQLPLSFRVVGEDDYMLEITVDAAGGFRVNSGDHTSHEPRTGVLTPPQMSELMELLSALGNPYEHPGPPGASGFMATLSLGEPTQVRSWRFWEGALEQEGDLARVVRALEVI